MNRGGKVYQALKSRIFFSMWENGGDRRKVPPISISRTALRELKRYLAPWMIYLNENQDGKNLFMGVELLEKAG